MKLSEKAWQAAKVEAESGEPDLASLVSAVLVEILCVFNKILHETNVVNSSDSVKDLENVVPSLITHLTQLAKKNSKGTLRHIWKIYIKPEIN